MNAQSIENARYALTGYRTPEGGLVLGRADTIELLRFLQETQDRMQELENALSHMSNCDDEAVTETENNVIELFPRI